MFPRVWEAVVGKSFESAPALLAGFEIRLVRGEAFPGIIPAECAPPVPGVVYRHLDNDSLRRLDEFESDFYLRKPVAVQLETGESIECDAYVVREENRDRLSEKHWDPGEFESRYMEYFLNSYFDS